jgi:RNA polymerase sigma-70 factor (ECF subfamily)
MTDPTREPPQRDGVPFACVTQAWREHESELRAFLAHRSGDADSADDLLQDVFIKAMRQGQHFCELRQPRAWLFEVARNALVDHARRQRPTEPIDDSLPADSPSEPEPIDALADCIARVLPTLETDDATVLRACDLGGERQAMFAARHGLTLPAVKSRVQRARQRLRAALISQCGVRFEALTGAQKGVCCVVPTDEQPGRLR